MTTSIPTLGVVLVPTLPPEAIRPLALAADPGAGGLTLLPYLDGERTPNLPEATGTLGGITRANATPENLARAAVEGMLCNLVSGVGSLTRLGVAAGRVLLIGGASGSAARRYASIAASARSLPSGWRALTAWITGSGS